MICTKHRSIYHRHTWLRLVEMTEGCLVGRTLVISSEARRAKSRNLHVGQGQTVRSLRALRLVEMTEGRLVEMTDYLGLDDRGALSRDDRRASQERSRSWKVASKSPVYQGSATSGAISAPASCIQGPPTAPASCKQA